MVSMKAHFWMALLTAVRGQPLDCQLRPARRFAALVHRGTEGASGRIGCMRVWPAPGKHGIPRSRDTGDTTGRSWRRYKDARRVAQRPVGTVRSVAYCRR
jgi:hypothetical protein